MPTDAEHFPAWTVPLTHAKSRDGRWAILDLSDGTITEHEVSAFFYDPDYAADDLRAWRNESRWQEEPTDRTLPVTEYFKRLGDKFRKLEWVGFWRDNSFPSLWMGHEFSYPNEEAETAEMRKIIKDHGWPDSFDRQTCEQVLTEYEGRNEERRQRERLQY